MLARANPHPTSIVSPERRLGALQVVGYLQGTKHVAFATGNERGEPRHFQMSESLNVDVVREKPAVSSGFPIGAPRFELGTSCPLRRMAGGVREWREVASLRRFRASLRLT